MVETRMRNKREMALWMEEEVMNVENESELYLGPLWKAQAAETGVKMMEGDEDSWVGADGGLNETMETEGN